MKHWVLGTALLCLLPASAWAQKSTDVMGFAPGMTVAEVQKVAKEKFPNHTWRDMVERGFRVSVLSYVSSPTSIAVGLGPELKTVTYLRASTSGEFLQTDLQSALLEKYGKPTQSDERAGMVELKWSYLADGAPDVQNQCEFKRGIEKHIETCGKRIEARSYGAPVVTTYEIVLFDYAGSVKDASRAQERAEREKKAQEEAQRNRVTKPSL
jgi:nicotinamidase-related amidase